MYARVLKDMGQGKGSAPPPNIGAVIHLHSGTLTNWNSNID